ncbi:MAG: VCBS repeat-containing protein, partial [Cyclobacteriaceae bacterium]
RADLGMNVDGMLLIDADHGEYGDIIATALPDVYWFEAQDQEGNSWKGIKIGEIPATAHVNGQGYAKAQIIPRGYQELLLATSNGIHYFEIPEKGPATEKWTVIHAVHEANDEGFGIGDIDGDGLQDVVAARREEAREENGLEIFWWKNPGTAKGNWKSFHLGSMKLKADRIAVADINGNGKADVVVTEGRIPGQGPNANLFWFERPSDPFQENWTRHHVVTQYSLNNLDVADMNGDGHADIITAEHKGPDLRLQVWRNDGNGNFSLAPVDRGKESHLGARVADLDGDGAMDIVSIGWDQYRYLHVWRNDALSHPPQPGPRISWHHRSSAQGDFLPPGVGDQAASLLLDIDKDGKDEIIIAGWGDTSSVWYKENGDTWDRYLLDASKSPSIGGAHYDLDGDGDQDIMFGGAWQSNEIWWWENPYPDYDPKKPWKKYTIRDTGLPGYHDQLFGDFDGDGKTELVFWNKRSGKLFIADLPSDPKDKNAWKFQEIWTWDAKTNYEGLAKTDIDLDGKDDIVGGGFWFKHVRGSEFKEEKIDDYGQSRTGVGDIITGGRPEVVMSSGDGIGPLNIYEWKEDKWEKTTLVEEVIHGHTLQVIDVDGDGNLDVFCAEMAKWAGGANPGSKTWILYGDGKGSFVKEEIKEAIDIGNHESRIGDFDGDGRMDIAQKPFQKDVPRLDIWLNKGVTK